MIKHIYSFRDKKLGVYGTPVFDVMSPNDFVENVRRGIVSDPVKNGMLRDCSVYDLGEFDDVRCSIESKLDLIVDLDQFFPSEGVSK